MRGVVTGIRFALERGGGRDAVPVRSAIFGAAMAVVVVVSTLTFGASLDKLVSHPSLYGWNWAFEINTPEGGGNIPAQPTTRLLDRDRDIAAWTGVYFDTMQLDGQTIPVIGASPRAPIGPPLLSLGHGFDDRGTTRSWCSGSATLVLALHKRVGDTVVANYGDLASVRRRLRIVGTATMPTVGALARRAPVDGNRRPARLPPDPG